MVSHPKLEHCYISRLTVRGVGHRDTRSYHVSVTNMHGTDTAPVHLTVRGEIKHYNLEHFLQSNVSHFSTSSPNLSHHWSQSAGCEFDPVGLHLSGLQN